MKVLQASVDRELPYEKETVERFVAGPALIVSWHPWIEKVSIFDKEGLSFRRSTLVGGETELVERCWQDEVDDVFHFQVVNGLWAENHYRTKISVRACEGGSRVSWRGRLVTRKPMDEEEQMKAYFEEGLKGLDDFLSDL